MQDSIFLGIGIQSYEGGLNDLMGARRSVKALGSWALSQGYRTQILTDEKGLVNSATVGDVLHALLGDGGQHRIIVAFAGHGMRRDGAEEFWLLSRWKDADGAIDIGRFRDPSELIDPNKLLS